jgi:hypothetical protein
MTLYRRFLILLLLCFFTFSGGWTQTVWPGDVNNNGIVNGVDLLYWGLAHGATGPSRDDETATWDPKQAPDPWGQIFPNGLNYYYADCNGDGKISEDDADDAINKNYGQTHGTVKSDGFANAEQGSAAPAIRLIPTTPVVGPGDELDISFQIDDSSMPVENFYGIAFTIRYSNDYLSEDEEIEFKLDNNTWLTEDESFVKSYLFNNQAEGTAMLAITRTDQKSVAIGEAEIGRFSVVIEDIIILKEIDTIQIEIDSVILISDDFGRVATQPASIEVIVAQNPDSILVVSSNSYNPMYIFDKAKAFPNPARRTFTIQTPVQLDGIEIFNAMGQQIDFEVMSSGKPLYQIRVASNIPSGLILVRLHAKGQAITRKLLYRSD